MILCCGTATAKLLQISGMGPGTLLSSIGVPVVLALSGVGENFRDHYAVRLVARVTNSVPSTNIRALGVGRLSIAALSPSLVNWFWKSNEVLDQPELQGIFSPANYKEGFVGLLDDYPGMTCGVWRRT